MSDKNALAQERTDWAEDRTIMANERTFAGWMRTGLSMLAIAIGLSAVFRETEPTWAAKGLATLFVLCAIVMFETARRASCKVQSRLNAHQAVPQGTRAMSAVAWILIVCAILTGALLWRL